MNKIDVKFKNIRIMGTDNAYALCVRDDSGKFLFAINGNGDLLNEELEKVVIKDV